jgi:HAE1 family hydrophobic/amphiphilic exporter-1
MFVVFTETAEDISFDSMAEHQQSVAAVLKEHPDVESLTSSFGSISSFVTPMNNGRVFCRLKPRHERTRSVDQIIEEIRPRLANLTGIKCYPQNPPAIPVGGMLTKSQYQYTLQGPDLIELRRAAFQLEAQIRQQSDVFQDVVTDLQIKNPQMDIQINRDKAATHGITAHQIEDALQNAFSSRLISTIYAPNDQFRVIIELLPEYQADPSALSLLYVRSQTGQLVPLDTLVTIRRSYGPLTINHLGQLPAVTVSFNLRPGAALSDAKASVENIARHVLPGTVSGNFQGTAQAFAASLGDMPMLLLMTVFVIYIILGILYESYIHPITILSGLPSAGIGALLTLMIFHVELNLYGIVGIIMLVGIVKKNAIMMIDFALEAQRKDGKTPQEAIYQGCLIRFRPIMMTTMAALVGTLPIALGYGAGGDARQPLGLVVVGGLLVSQLITLYLTPVFYTYMEDFVAWLRRIRS